MKKKSSYLSSNVRLELPQDDPDVALAGHVGDDLQLEDLDVRGVGAANEEVPEEWLEHGVALVAGGGGHGGDAVEHDGLDLLVAAQEADHGLGDDLRTKCCSSGFEVIFCYRFPFHLAHSVL